MAASASNGDDLVQQFCAVTGADVETGIYLLEACGGDLEMAIGMHIDGSGINIADRTKHNVQNGGAAAVATDLSDVAGPSTSYDNDGVRAPIPQTQEILVEDNFVLAGRQNRRRKNNSVFDGFRDFQAEARQQALVVNGDPLATKRRTLEDLFRPPIELLHKGSFRSACEAGKASNRWLLVNVQNVREFACQALNRDVWSHTTVKEIVNEHFLLWQVYSDSEDDRKYMQFYHVTNWPYVAVLDPRTGENMLTMNRVDANSFCEIMTEFLSVHPVPDQSFEDELPTKRFKSDLPDPLVDASEESQLNAAIAASLGASCPSSARGTSCGTRRPSSAIEIVSDDSDVESDDDLETFTDEDSQPAAASVPSRPVDTEITVSAKGKAPFHATRCVVDRGLVSTQSTGSTVSTQSRGDSVVEVLENGDSSRCSSDGDSTPLDSNGADGSKDSWENYRGPSSDPASCIVFRFPDGVRKSLSLPCSSTLRALFCYVNEQGYSNRMFELVTTFPRRKLTNLDQDSTLKANGLHPQETIFIQEL